jgi:uncharacterized glyoxalase superfamily protein PhnB
MATTQTGTTGTNPMMAGDVDARYRTGADYWTDRSYGAIDPEGHHWWFTQRLRG